MRHAVRKVISSPTKCLCLFASEMFHAALSNARGISNALVAPSNDKVDPPSQASGHATPERCLPHCDLFMQ